jgi:cobalamin transport system substrate-binding protein
VRAFRPILFRIGAFLFLRATIRFRNAGFQPVGFALRWKAKNAKEPAGSRRYQNWQHVLAAIALCALAAAPLCAQVQEGPALRPATGTTTPSSSPAFREVTDEAGRRVRVPVDVRRIVSLAPSLTEVLYAIGAGPRVVGVTDFCDYPPETAGKQKVGGPMNPSLEQIVALKPDLILAQANGGNRRETVDALDRLGLPVYAADARTVDQVIESAHTLAALVGVEEQGAKLAAELHARLNALKEKLAGRTPRRVFFVVWHEPLITIGRNTFLADAMRLAGGELALDLEQDWPRISLEKVVSVQPDVLVFASTHDEETRRTIDELRQLPGWRILDAVRNNRVVILSDAVNRPAPRLIDCIEQLARELHPDAFAEKPENEKMKMEKIPPLAFVAPFPYSLFAFPTRVAANFLPGGLD